VDGAPKALGSAGLRTHQEHGAERRPEHPGGARRPHAPNDPREPNDTVAEAAVQPALTTPARPSNRIAATLTAVNDPRDFYRIWKRPRHRVRLSVTGPVVARVVGSDVEVTLRAGASTASYVLSVKSG